MYCKLQNWESVFRIPLGRIELQGDGKYLQGWTYSWSSAFFILYEGHDILYFLKPVMIDKYVHCWTYSGSVLLFMKVMTFCIFSNAAMINICTTRTQVHKGRQTDEVQAWEEDFRHGSKAKVKVRIGEMTMGRKREYDGHVRLWGGCPRCTNAKTDKTRTGEHTRERT
jgi:hypothetical protein